MSSNKPSEASSMARLEDALLEDIFALPEADLDAELEEIGIDPVDASTSTRDAIEKGAKAAAKAGLAEAAADLAAFRRSRGQGASDSASGRALLERIKARDPDVAEMMIAARKGQQLSESDEAGIAEDLADLEKLARKLE